jgi:spermidine synthase
MNPSPLTVACLLFGSGLCALAYQTTWLREFRLIFGASTPASAAVLAIFMGGLGLGSAVLGKRSERKERPLAYYGKLELFIALSAALTPALVWLVRAAYVGLGGTQALGSVAGTALRLVLASLVLAMPTFLMGGTLPAAARAVETEADPRRRRLALLYGANTLGAVAGAGLATFFLLEHLGNRLTLWSACALNTAVALTALWLARRKVGPASRRPLEFASKEQTEQPSSRHDAAGVTTQGAGGTPALRWSFILAAAAIVGFAFFVMEMVWFRLLTPLLGGSAFTFGLILAVALLGIGLGGLLYALLGAQRPATLTGFAFTCALEAVCLGYPFALGDRVAVLAALLRPLGTFEFYGHVVAWTVVTALVVLPAAVVAGFQFPLLIGLLGRGAREVGRHTGLAYAWNTVGAIVGALAGGFGILPWLTAPGTWRMVVGLLVALAGTALLAVGRESARGMTPGAWTGAVGRWVPTLAMGILALLCVRATGPTAVWRHSPIGAGRVAWESFSSRNALRDWAQSTRGAIAWQADGRETSVALDEEAAYTFLVDGKSDGNARIDAPTQVMAGMIGAILHPEPRRVFVVGLGTGSTAGWLGAIPTIERVDVAELEPAILKVAEACAPVNAGVLSNPRVKVLLGDGRELLLTARQSYDLVVSEPSNLYRAGVASLYTTDFYRAARRKLAEGGLFVQWVQGYETDLATLQTVYRTLTTVFPHVESWHSKEVDLVFVASLRPLTYDVARLRQRVQEPTYRQALEKAWRATNLEGFLARYVANAAFAPWVAAQPGGSLNTDNRMVLEFAYGRSVGRSRGDHVAHLRETAETLNLDRPPLTNGAVDWRACREQRASALVLQKYPPPVPRLGTNLINRALAQRAYVDGELEDALYYWRLSPREPGDLVERAMVAELLANAGEAQALPHLEALRAFQPIEADAILARFHWARDDATNAVTALESAFRAYRADPWPQAPILRRALQLAADVAEASSAELGRRLFTALETRFAASCENGRRLRTRLKIAEALEPAPGGELTLQALLAFEPHGPWEEEFLQTRSACYTQHSHPLAVRARRELEEFLRQEPPLLHVDEEEDENPE